MSVIVEVSNVSINKLENFLQFCGDISSINEISKDKYQVNFKNSSAVETALLLDNAELDGQKLSVSDELPSFTEATEKPSTSGETNDLGTVTGKPITVGDFKQDTKTGDDKYDDIEQEHKPKYVIMAQLLSKGYKINDDIIEKSIKFDKKHGYSEKFKKFVDDLDYKLGSMTIDDKTALENAKKEDAKLSEPVGAADAQSTGKEDVRFSTVATNQINANIEGFKKTKYYGKLSKYFDKFSNDLDKAQKDFSKNPYGVKIHGFYKNLVGDVKAVHEEAKRLSEIKESPNDSPSVTNTDLPSTKTV